jgi:hypothetical protein
MCVYAWWLYQRCNHFRVHIKHCAYVGSEYLCEPDTLSMCGKRTGECPPCRYFQATYGRFLVSRSGSVGTAVEVDCTSGQGQYEPYRPPAKECLPGVVPSGRNQGVLLVNSYPEDSDLDDEGEFCWDDEEDYCLDLLFEAMENDDRQPRSSPVESTCVKKDRSPVVSKPRLRLIIPVNEGENNKDVSQVMVGNLVDTARESAESSNATTLFGSSASDSEADSATTITDGADWEPKGLS